MFLRAALAALIPAFAVAADKKLPLPAKMLEDGWVALFDGKSTFGWKVQCAARRSSPNQALTSTPA